MSAVPRATPDESGCLFEGEIPSLICEIDISRLLRGEEMRWKEIQRDHVTRHPPPEGNP